MRYVEGFVKINANGVTCRHNYASVRAASDGYFDFITNVDAHRLAIWEGISDEKQSAQFIGLNRGRCRQELDNKPAIDPSPVLETVADSVIARAVVLYIYRERESTREHMHASTVR